MNELLCYTSDFDAAEQEINQLGGLVRLRLTSKAFVAALPLAELSTLVHCKIAPNGNIDDETERLVGIWKASNVPRAPTPSEGVVWNSPDYSTPGAQVLDLAEGEAAIEYEQSTGTPTSRYMTGRISAGIIIVDSNTPGELQFSDDEHATLRDEVLRSMHFLSHEEPRANIGFYPDFKEVAVSLPSESSSVSDPYENLERRWRDTALAELGFPAGRAGYQAYLQQLMSELGTEWGFVAFFTKFPVHWFAYAIWEKVVMHFNNDAWGPSAIHRVFAHEICHVFGAADEYGNCQCGSLHGHLQSPNNNCVSCFGSVSEQAPCLMDRNVLTICEHTRKQIGWCPPLIETETTTL